MTVTPEQTPTTPAASQRRLAWLRRPLVAVPLALVLLAGFGVAMAAFQPWKVFVDSVVVEAAPTAPSDAAGGTATEPVVLATGSFISHEHETTGSVSVLLLADGSRVLRLEDLATSNGPDLKVWLTDAPVIEGTDGWRVFDDGAWADLGALKGNVGSQNYAIPAEVDLAELTSVSIWCDRFDVSFGAAALTLV
jgi:Electron transfer DM13